LVKNYYLQRWHSEKKGKRLRMAISHWSLVISKES